MDCFIGIDLGSTTSKAIYMDGNENFLGRGITNSRSNYHLACQIAQEEAENNSRFTILERNIKESQNGKKIVSDLMYAFLIVSPTINLFFDSIFVPK